MAYPNCDFEATRRFLTVQASFSRKAGLEI
jgi:hypothetical protein